MKTSVKVEGFRELDAALGEFTKATAVNILKRAGVEALEPMREVAERLAPDDPETSARDLKDNIVVGTKTRSSKKRLKESTVEVFMGPDASVPFATKKGVQQEFGNINHGPQPFMRPAYEQEKRPTIDRVRDSLAGEIEKARVRAARKALKPKGRR